MSELGWLQRLEAAVFGTNEIVEVVPLTGGEINETVRVRCSSGEQFVVRRAPSEVADWHPSLEGQMAAMKIAQQAGVPVPEVIYASGRVLAYRFVQGAAITVGVQSGALARDAGRMYGLLHRHLGDGLGPVQADGRSPKWPDDVSFREVGSWAEGLLGLPGPSPFNAADIEGAAELLATHRPPPTSRLVHGDASPGNTIVSGSEIVALVDFDDAWWGDPAGDMAWWWWNDPDSGDEFAAGCAESNEPAPRPTIWLHRVRLLLGLADAFAATNAERGARIARLLPTTLTAARRAVSGE